MALYPPGAVCKQLFHIHRWLRLAWHAKEKKADEQNPGSFGIVQLYHIRDAGTVDNPNTFLLHWDELGETRGPIFNRYGGTSLDYDPLFRRPIYVANLEELGITKEQVFSGEFLNDVRHWLRPFRERAAKNAEELSNEMRRQIDDVAREKTDYLWSLANRSDAESIIMPYEDARLQMQEWERTREQTQRALHNYYRAPGL